MKKTVALLLALILVFTLSISAFAYAAGPTEEGSGPEPEPGPQPEPAPVQPAGSGTGDALRFSDSVLNAPLFVWRGGGIGFCNLGNGKTIYTFLAETLEKWKGQSVKTIMFQVNNDFYEISMADLLDSLKEAGADSVHVRLGEDGLHLYARVKEFGGVKRVDIATLQPAGDQPAGDQPAGDQPAGDQPAAEQPTGDQPAGDQSSAVQPAAQVDTAMQAKEGTWTAKAEQERKMQFDPFPEKTNRFDEQDRPLYTYEEKANGTTVVTEYTYEDDKVLSVLTKTINPDGTGIGKYSVNNAETLLAAKGTIKYTKFGQNGQHAIEDYDVASGDKKYTMTVLKTYNAEGKLEKVVWKLSTGSETILRTETGSFNQHGTSSSDNSKWDDLYQTDPGLRYVIDMIYDM